MEDKDVRLTLEGNLVKFGTITIGEITDPNVIKQLGVWYRNNAVPFDIELVKRFIEKRINTKVCPLCGGEFHKTYYLDKNVEIGFCIDCATRLFKSDGKVKVQGTGMTGHTEYFNHLAGKYKTDPFKKVKYYE